MPVNRTTAFRGKCFLETHSMYTILCQYKDIVRSHVLVARHGQDPPDHGREIDRHCTGNMYLHVMGAHQQVRLQDVGSWVVFDYLVACFYSPNNHARLDDQMISVSKNKKPKNPVGPSIYYSI